MRGCAGGTSRSRISITCSAPPDRRCSPSCGAGLWFIGTVGSLAPYIGLFGTVIGIMVAFGAIAESGDAGFEVVSAGISEALIATAVGLLVAIVSLALFNWLQVRVGGIAASFTRASERFIQALLYVEAAPPAAPDRSAEVADGNLIPARG